MSYCFRDRAKEWTSYVGVGLSALAAVIPQVVPPNTWWVELWQASQMGLGIALVFIPHSAGSTAIENEAWSLLKAFAAKLPAEYAGPMQGVIQTLGAALANSQIPRPTPVQTTPVPAPVPAQPVPTPAPDPAPAVPAPAPSLAPASRPQPQPLVADPAAALAPITQ